ncbi:disease resistance TIR-NBS-LRR class family protein [Tanacetum coccineum]
MSSNKRLRLSDPSSITLGASTSSSSTRKRFKYDVFISFRGEDTRKTFVGHLYQALTDKGIYTYKDDEKIQKGETIDNQLIQAIKDSRFFLVVFSKNYTSSSWCLDELVEIMDCQKKIAEQTAYPVFFDVEPTHVRKQNGPVGEAFSKHENQEAVGKWRDAMKEASNLAGWELKATANGDESKSIQIIVDAIFKKLHSNHSSADGKLVGMETRISDVLASLESDVLASLENGTEDVRMIGIKGMGGGGKTTLARAVYDQISNHFEGKSFVENVREVSKTSLSGLKKLQKKILKDVLNKQDITFSSVHDGRDMLIATLRCKKILIVLDDVDHIEQLEALAGEHDWFKSGSRIIITTRDEQVLSAHRVNFVHDVNLLSSTEAICLFNRYAFQKEIPLQGYKELAGKVVRYAAGLPLTVKVLGSFLYGKDKLEWVDAIERLKKIPLKETLEKLELSYIGLEDDYKEIFLDIACILKGKNKTDAITIFESCGFHARNGLKVLEQRSLITISKGGFLGMHDHIEEMGKNIVRRSHCDEPNKHSRLWIDEEIEDILANDMGTEETRCLKLDMSRGNSRIVMNGLGKMKKLRYLEVNYADYDSECDCESDGECLGIDPKFDESTQYFPNSLKYLKCERYPFLYLPKTFQANNLVGLEMESCRNMVQLWEEGEKKDLRKLKFLSLSESELKTFDFRITPNLESLSLDISYELEELYMPGCQKLKYLHISHSKLIPFDLGLTPNLETLSLFDCTHFVKLKVSVACPNLKFLNLNKLRLMRSLDLELIPNLESLDLHNSDELVEINAPVGCLKKVVYFDLSGCWRFHQFVFRGGCEQINIYSATLHLDGETLDLCSLHPNSNLPKLRFRCYYKECLASSVGNIEKLISFGLCACTDLKKFSDIICSLQCLQKLTLKCNIPEFPNDLGQLGYLEELCLYSTKIKHLPDSICMLKHLKFLKVNYGYLGKLQEDLLEKLPEDLGQLECLEKLYVSSKTIEYFPDSICMLKRLKLLDVTGCCRLGKLPEDIGQLESLEMLVLWATKIKHLPDSICMLKHLKFLNLDDCALLEKLPEDLGRLECLERLHVRSEKIEFLPDSICFLKHLKYLDLHNCALLEKLPEDLGRLKCLTAIAITGTGISHLPHSILGLKGLLIAASPELLQLYHFPSEINTTTSYISLTKVEFPKFDEEDVQGWLYRVNKLFEMDQIVDDDQRIRLVSMHVFGKALNWHKHFMKRFEEVVTWGVYETQIKKRFESVFEDPVVELKNLKQTTNVQLVMKCEEDEDCVLTEQGIISTIENEEEIMPQISLNAMTGIPNYQTMRI